MQEKNNTSGSPTFQDRKRLVWILLFIFLLFSFLIVRFYHIQIIEGEKWERQARRQHYFTVNEPFHRGTFYSDTSLKRGHPETPQAFTLDIQKYHLFIDPDSIPVKQRDPIAKNLIEVLDLDIVQKMQLRSHFDKKSRSRKLAMWLDQEVRDRILQWWGTYAKQHKIVRNALFFTSDYQRSYPFGKLLGQVLHTVQEQRDESTRQAIPTGGLELYFDSYLRGKEGSRLLMRSPRNAFEMGEMIASPEDGADVYLTINHGLQAIVEEELARGVKKSKAKSGWAVMMQPFTGEILALAQFPFFYPPDYQSYFNDPQMIEHTKVKAVTDAWEPGSVIKPFTICAAFLANEELKRRGQPPLFDPSEIVSTVSGKFPGRSRPLNDTSLHYYMNMQIAVQKSANIYMARLAEKIVSRLGADWYRGVLHDLFGFGKKTGIELPSETRGVLPTIGKKHPNGTMEWSASTPYSLAIGYNLQTNSIQLLRAHSILANGGYLVEPTLVKKIVKRENDHSLRLLVDHTRPERQQGFPRVLSPKIVKEVVEAMKFTTKPGGTAYRADIRGYTEAGKTGTSKKIVNGAYADHYRASFIGFTPVKNAAFVLIVTLDEPEYGYLPGVGKNHNGGVSTALMFRETAKRSLEYLGIPPDDPYGYPSGDPRADPKKADWMTETRQLQEIYQKWNNKPEH